jgi:hypothetical protein
MAVLGAVLKQRVVEVLIFRRYLTSTTTGKLVFEVCVGSGMFAPAHNHIFA